MLTLHAPPAVCERDTHTGARHRSWSRCPLRVTGALVECSVCLARAVRRSDQTLLLRDGGGSVDSRLRRRTPASRAEEHAMEAASKNRVLIVANRTAATHRLLDEV